MLLGRYPPWLRRRAARVCSGEAVARLGLEELTANRLLELADDPELRELLLDRPSLEPPFLIGLAAQRPDLARAAERALRDCNGTALSTALYRTVVLDRAGDQRSLHVALATITTAPERIAPEQARSIFARCLDISAQPMDPYSAGGAASATAARQAAAAILAIDSGLDESVITALSDAESRPAVQTVIASALKERPDRAAKRFGAFLAALAVPREQAIRFAEDCDADRGSLREIPRRLPRGLASIGDAAKGWPRAWVWFACSLAGPVLMAAALAFVCRHASRTLTTAGVDAGVAIVALGVLAAVHVLSVQLAAQRLPGPIASAVAITPLTLSGYTTGLLMLIASILGQEDPPPAWHPSLVASGLLVILFVQVVAATTLSLRTTSLAAASEAVGRRRIGQARRTGRLAGDLHRLAAECRQVVDTHPCLRLFTSAQENAQRYPIRAANSGYLTIDIARLETAAQRDKLINGDLRLDLLVLPSIAVVAGQELASLVPVASAELDEDDLRAVEAPFKVSDMRQLERFAELCATLCSQLRPLVALGDAGGARRILHVLRELLQEHVASEADTCGSQSGVLPLSPALTQVIDEARAALRASTTESERDPVVRVLETVLELARKDDGIVTVIANRVGQGATTLADFGVLCDAGQRAALNDSRLELLVVQHSFDGLSAGESKNARYANEAAGRLVAYCASVAPRLSRAAWQRWWEHATESSTPDRVAIALRIGAASLPVANLSLAVEISLALSTEDFDALAVSLGEEFRAAFEGFLSTSYGRLLGVDAQQRLLEFVQFARNVNASIAAPAPDPQPN
ncbi:MAG: hypothetical protein ACLPV4_21250 [Solirubrobacteraceae bacterium]